MTLGKDEVLRRSMQSMFVSRGKFEQAVRRAGVEEPLFHRLEASIDHAKEEKEFARKKKECLKQLSKWEKERKRVISAIKEWESKANDCLNLTNEIEAGIRQKIKEGEARCAEIDKQNELIKQYNESTAVKTGWRDARPLIPRPGLPKLFKVQEAVGLPRATINQEKVNIQIAQSVYNDRRARSDKDRVSKKQFSGKKKK